MPEAHLNFVGTATPAHDIHDSFLRFARERLEVKSERALFDRMAERSRVRHRFSVLAARDGTGSSLDVDGVYTHGAFPSTAARMRLFEAHAPTLAMSACAALAEKTPIERITHVVVTSCTGLYAPGIDHAIVRALHLAPTVERTMVGFMGCSAAMNALKLARHIVRSEPASRVLIVNVELCSLHLQAVQDVERMLTFALFADGAAASLVTADEVGLCLDGFYGVTIPGTEDLITWHVGDSGFDMHLSGRVPAAVAAGLDASASALLRGGRPTEIDRWAVHPGGRSILEAVERGLGISRDALAPSWDVLDRFGNMSSATISFVLETVLDQASANERGCALAFGPGLCAESMLFHKV